MQTSCEVDVTYFPFDSQACYILIESWSYDGASVKLKNTTDGIQLDKYHENGQWELYHHRTIHRAAVVNDTKVYYQVIFIVHLRRKPLFMVMTIVLPSIILALLVILVFYLPADAGEKFSLGITLLLSFSVFQLLLADYMPTTSDYTPMLSKTFI